VSMVGCSLTNTQKKFAKLCESTAWVNPDGYSKARNHRKILVKRKKQPTENQKNTKTEI